MSRSSAGRTVLPQPGGGGGGEHEGQQQQAQQQQAQLLGEEAGLRALAARMPAYATCLTPTHWLLPGQETGGGDAAWTFAQQEEAADVKRLEQARLDRQNARQAALPARPTVITRLPAHLSPHVLASAVLLVDKPQDWSADEVARSLTWALKSRRLGYVGTLEPMASGLMVVLLGQATALTPQLRGVPQRFTGVLRLGIETDTHDACGRVTATAAWSHITDEQIEGVAAGFRGEFVQVPPAYSPVKQKSRPVYDLAKRRPLDELRPAAVRTSELTLQRLEPEGSELGFSVTFARNGHVRALAQDIGLALGCYAHVHSLRRESLGGFSVEDAWPLDVLLPTARKFKSSIKRGLPGG